VASKPVTSDVPERGKSATQTDVAKWRREVRGGSGGGDVIGVAGRVALRSRPLSYTGSTLRSQPYAASRFAAGRWREGNCP